MLAAIPTVRAEVRTTKAKHVLRCVQIDALSSSPHWSAELMAAQLLRRNCGSAVAVMDGEPVGFILWKAHRRCLIVERFGVLPSCRRLGIATLLLRRAVARLSGKRNAVVIDVPETALDAQLWLRACGVRAVQSIRDYYGPDQAAIRFRLAKE